MEIKQILFNTEMVKAILDGRKTQTRRLIKRIPLHAPYFELYDGKPTACDSDGDWHPLEKFSTIQPGDILWVRETWNYGYVDSNYREYGPYDCWFEQEDPYHKQKHYTTSARYYYLANEEDKKDKGDV